MVTYSTQKRGAERFLLGDWIAVQVSVVATVEPTEQQRKQDTEYDDCYDCVHCRLDSPGMVVSVNVGMQRICAVRSQVVVKMGAQVVKIGSTMQVPVVGSLAAHPARGRTASN